MAITLIGHQPIDFTYKENDPCEKLSDMCLQYETADNPMFQIKVTGSSAPLVTIQGVGSTDYDEAYIPVELISVSGDFWTFTINFEELGITEGCYELCVYDIGLTGTNLITNGTFVSDLSGWSAVDGLVLGIDSYTMDSVTLIASGGTAPYTYSMDGINYQAGTLFSDLDMGVPYTFYVKDSNGVIRSIPFTIIDCSAYSGSEAYDIKDLQAFDIKDCEAADFV